MPDLGDVVVVVNINNDRVFECLELEKLCVQTSNLHHPCPQHNRKCVIIIQCTPIYPSKWVCDCL